ncbi:MAG TPA: RnfABCDGE type electron transport complex subunit D [Chloroflexota bacterium]|nr:RnfABCDGE type electron transport complex subunit D [Chloroflexota bacterium]
MSIDLVNNTKHRQALWAQTGVLLLFTILGQALFRFDVSPIQVALGVVAAWVAEIVLARCAHGKWAFPLSATISGLSVGLLLRSTELWPFAAASILAIASKYALRFNGRHVFNPSNLGITILLLLPLTETRLDPGQWPNLGLLLFLVAALGIVVLFKASRLALVLPFAAGWAIVLLANAQATGFPLPAALRPLLTGAAILFAFFMLTDPRTTPVGWRGQALFGATTGALGGLFMIAGLPYAIFLALLITCLVYGVFEWRRTAVASQPEAPVDPDRRAFMTGVGAAALSAGFLAAWPLAGRSGRGNLADRWTASGGGVNLKYMPDESGNPTVPLRENFSFDMNQAICSVEYNAQRFVMPTYGAGKQTIEPGQFFMLMVAPNMTRRAVTAAPNGARKLILEGDLDCTTYAATSESSFGSRDKPEPATFHIEAVDGGGKPGPDGRKPGDSFAFSVYFLKDTAPVNFAIFGPSATFTGDMIAGRVTIRSLDELTA